MNISKSILPIFAALIMASPPHAVAAAADLSAAAAPGMQLAQSDGATLGEAVERVRRQYKGRIVSAETQRRGNREIHVIKVLTDDGKVKTVTIPGRSLGQRG